MLYNHAIGYLRWIMFLHGATQCFFPVWVDTCDKERTEACSVGNAKRCDQDMTEACFGKAMWCHVATKV